jgi:RsiW-degrading membrane proteinase PrsW (M82 family)
MNNGPLQIHHGFPPLTSLAAVLICAALLIALYQKLFPKPARWPLVILALIISVALTISYVLLLAPGAQRLGDIHDLWSALRFSVLSAGLPEEGVKFLAALIAISLFNRATTPAEAFQASLCAAIGFAIVENSVYAKAFSEFALPIAFGRGIVASFIHSLMAMIQGTFLARFVATGWRRFHLLPIGYLCAAAAHAGFDWGLLRMFSAGLMAQSVSRSTILASFLVMAICMSTVLVLGLWLFRRALRRAGDAELHRIREAYGAGSDEELEYFARIRRWKYAGNALLILGCIGLIAVIGVVIYLAATGAIQLPQPGAAPPALSAEALKSSLAVTGAIIASPAALVLGWLLRQKR